MRNYFLSRLVVFTAIFLLIVLLFSQRWLSASAADLDQLETTATPTITPTPGCSPMIPGSFIVTGGDDLQFTVTNNNFQQVSLTSTTLYWTDYYDPNMLADYFRFGAVQYWNGDDFDSPTTVTSDIPFSSLSMVDWNLDFDGYGNIYGQTHTIGPFTVVLTFNGNCSVSATIPAVFGQIAHPSEGQIITGQGQTNFEAIGWDTGVGNTNGAGVDRIHIVVINSVGTEIVNRNDSSAPFCAWGDDNPCPVASDLQWESLINGDFQMMIWARSGINASWSPPHIVNFTIQKALPTFTATPTITLTPTKTPNPTRTSPPGGTSTSTPTSLPGVTNTPRPTKTPNP